MVYFDNAATTFPKPEEVYLFMDKFYRECGVNVGRGQHKLASRASSLVEETRQLLRSLFHAPSKNIIFTNSATEALNLILQGITIKENYNIYITPFEHNAVTRILHFLQTKYKLNIIELEVGKTSLEYDLDKISQQFAEKSPNLLIASHASNVCGIIAPIYELCTLAKKYRAITIIDMAQTAGLIDTDLNSDIYDFAVFAGHKTLYAPFGIAGIVAKDFPLTPLYYGGTGVDSANQELPLLLPERYEVGSQNILAIAGLNASLKWIDSKGLTHIAQVESENRLSLVNTLSHFNNIILIGNDIKNIGIVSAIFNSYSSDNIGQILSEHYIAVRTGLQCAPIAHKFLNTFPEGTVRFSVSYFNTQDDFEKLHCALKYIEENS